MGALPKLLVCWGIELSSCRKAYRCLLLSSLLASLHRRANPANRFQLAFLLIYAVNYLGYLLEGAEF
ncbi:MAG: hypothetical protein ACR2RF_31955 [Geminicoccaceae bacterium]